jgi:hypothetical protein
MVKVASLFSQLLHHFPRVEFASLVRKHGAERRAKGFTCWNQLVSMLFCQLARADSLREICGGLSCCLGKLVHLGIGKAPSRSTLSYANEHRPSALYEDLFRSALKRVSESRDLLELARRSSASRTSCSPSTPRPSRCVWRFSRGRNSVRQREASRRTSSWTTTTTCPPSSASRRPRNTTSRLLGCCVCPRTPSWRGSGLQ